MTNVVIVSAARTAVGSFGGSFANTPAHDLGSTVLEALVERAGIEKSDVSETILGQVLTGGQGQNPARQAHINAVWAYSIFFPIVEILSSLSIGLMLVWAAIWVVGYDDYQIGQMYGEIFAFILWVQMLYRPIPSGRSPFTSPSLHRSNN